MNTVIGDNPLVLGDLGPPFTETLMQAINGPSAPFVFEDGDVVTLTYVDPNGAEHQVTATAGDDGQVIYHWQSGDLPVAGVYKAQIKVSRSGADFPQTFPDTTGFFTWRVFPSLSGATPGPFGLLVVLPPIEYIATGGEGDVTITIPGVTMADLAFHVSTMWAGSTAGGGQSSGAQGVDYPADLLTSTSFTAVFGADLVAGDRIRFLVVGRIVA